VNNEERKMNNKSILAAILVLALATLACSINIDLPGDNVKTGATESKNINVPLFDDADRIADVELNFGAGELTLESGAEDAIIDGTATYNVKDFEPEIEIFGNNVKMSQGSLDIDGIPDFDERVINKWELQLGGAPMNLTIKAGAYEGEYELGGLALHKLDVSDGAAKINLTFSEPNLVSMDMLRYNTGASDVSLSGLANANFSEMVFRSGAGSYKLDFSGDLQQDADVEIVSGISSVTIIVPEGINARLRFEGALTEINTYDGWKKSGDEYTLSGSGATLTITVKMGAGSLDLRSR
jgi:hypothetical protein